MVEGLCTTDTAQEGATFSSKEDANGTEGSSTSNMPLLAPLHNPSEPNRSLSFSDWPSPGPLDSTMTISDLDPIVKS